MEKATGHSPFTDDDVLNSKLRQQRLPRDWQLAIALATALRV